MARRDAVLTLDGLTVRYGPRTAVANLDLAVGRGEVVGLLGANGSGKSTTLSACAGLVRPAAGAVALLGLSPTRNALAYRRHLGLVPQEPAVYEELSGRENLAFFGRLYGLAGAELKRRLAEALHFVRLADRADDLAATYSGGMVRRLNLACALLHKPALLLLDEPTVGLDVASREAIADCLALLREAGTALLYATHHLDEAEALCDRLVVLRHGRLVADAAAGRPVPRLDRLLRPVAAGRPSDA